MSEGKKIVIGLVIVAIVWFFVGFFLVGCGADYGRVKVDEKSIEVEAGKDGDGHHHDKDSKCPPGHRMKGWCK